MKAKQIKKLLSITLASAMVVSGEPGIPAIVMAEDETQSDVMNEQIAEGEATDSVGNQLTITIHLKLTRLQRQRRMQCLHLKL